MRRLEEHRFRTNLGRWHHHLIYTLHILLPTPFLSVYAFIITYPRLFSMPGGLRPITEPKFIRDCPKMILKFEPFDYLLGLSFQIVKCLNRNICTYVFLLKLYSVAYKTCSGKAANYCQIHGRCGLGFLSSRRA